MKSIHARALLMALGPSLVFICAVQVPAQKSPAKTQPVRVVNTAKNPVPTFAAPDTTQYQFQSIVAFQGGAGCANNYGNDYCTFNGSQNVRIEQTLTTLSSQGYELVSVAPIPSGAAGIASTYVLYTLRAPLTGNQSRRHGRTVQP
jgi:hypothetical protein